MYASRLPAQLLSSLLLLAGTSCSLCREPDIEPATLAPSGIRVRYAQTQCADRWGQANAQQLATVATTYLTQQGLTFTDAHATQSAPAAVCNACTCPTGVVLEGCVAPGDLVAIQALGFTKK